MKIATGIIGMMLGLLVILQSCALGTLASIGDMKAEGEAGAVGMLVGLLLFIGGAFGFGLPTVSLLSFALAALLAFALSGTFTDMGIWGVAAIILAVMAFFARRADQKAKAARSPAQ